MEETAVVGATASLESIFAPVVNGLDAEIQIVEVAGGWSAGVRARLPEEGYTRLPSDVPALSRADAVADACEELIAWLSGQKDRGGKRHRQQAEALQDWALAVEKEAAAAPASAVHASANLPPVQMVPTGEVYDSPRNPRQHYPETAMAQLVESMRTSGFRPWLPLVVRPRADGGYEIGAGHRRRRAAEAAGILMVPCLIREMTDEEFLDVLNFDNSGREDVHPLDESAGWRDWMAKTGKGVLDIAARIGQSKEYVYQRLKYAALIEPAKTAFLEGQVTAGHAILIARLPEKEQQKALKFCLTEDWQQRRPSVRSLADYLHSSAYIDLRDDCPFDRTDAALVAGAGSCEECSKRARNIPGFEFEEDDPEADLCTDRACHQHKVDNHLVRIRKELEAKGGPVVVVSGSYGTRKKGVLGPGEYERVDPGTKGAVEALCAEGSELGQVVTVRLKRTNAAKPEASAAGQKAAQEKAEQARKAKVERELSVRRAILAAVTAKVGGLSRADIETLLAEALRDREDAGELCRLHGIKFATEWSACEDLVAALPKMPDMEINRLVVEVTVVDELDDWQLDRQPTDLLALAKRYKVDAAKIRRDMEEAGKEAEGGTREEVGKPAAAKKAAKAKKAPAKKEAKAKKAPKTLTPAMRKRIAAAQKARWAQHKKQLEKKGK